MKKLFQLFAIRREERWPVLLACLLFSALNGLMIWRYFDRFTAISSHYHKLFVSVFRVSGFDPLTYEVVSSWSPAYNVYRHPLLAFFMYLPNQLNQALIWLTGMNCVQFVVAAIWVVASVYSFVFLYRILREIIHLERCDALLLSALFFSFAYILLSVMVPDHFCLSLMLLLLTLYVAGKRQQQGRDMSIAEVVLLFIFTAGVSLNNGLKTFAVALLTNRWRFFRPKFLFLGVLMPALLMWGFARWEYRTFVWPKEMARKEAKAREVKRHRDAIYQQFVDTCQTKDSALIARGVQLIIKQKAHEKYVRDHKKVWNKNAGKPIAKGEFSRWTDISTPRWPSIVENLMGESLQLHSDYLLQDVLRSRPVIVPYRHWWNYVAELLLCVLFAAGIWVGRRECFLWTVMSCFALDMVLHVVFGFGLNEVYIMTAHWAFALPLAMAYLFRGDQKRWLRCALRTVVALLATFLMAYNLAHIVQFMTH